MISLLLGIVLILLLLAASLRLAAWLFPWSTTLVKRPTSRRDSDEPSSSSRS